MNKKKETKQFYDAIAERSFKEWLDNQALMPTLKKFMENLPPDPMVLDLGCGIGGESKRLVNLGAQVIGVDFSRNSLEYAERYVPEAEFFCVDILKMKFENCYFDGILEAGTLFHFEEDEQNKILRNIMNILKPEGIFLSYYPEGEFEGMQELEVSGKKYRRYARTMKKKDWINQVMKHGFKRYTEYDFNVGTFTCLLFYR